MIAGFVVLARSHNRRSVQRFPELSQIAVASSAQIMAKCFLKIISVPIKRFLCRFGLNRQRQRAQNNKARCVFRPAKFSHRTFLRYDVSYNSCRLMTAPQETAQGRSVLNARFPLEPNLQDSRCVNALGEPCRMPAWQERVASRMAARGGFLPVRSRQQMHRSGHRCFARSRPHPDLRRKRIECPQGVTLSLLSGSRVTSCVSPERLSRWAAISQLPPAAPRPEPRTQVLPKP